MDRFLQLLDQNFDGRGAIVLVLLQRVKHRGYGVSDNEYILGVISIGAPVFDRSGHVIAALSITGPNSRITQEVLPQAVGSARLHAEGQWRQRQCRRQGTRRRAALVPTSTPKTKVPPR